MLNRSKLLRHFGGQAKQTTPAESHKDYWNKTAEWYMKYNIENSNKMYKAMAPFLQLQDAKRIIDAGCGAGNGVGILSKFTKPDTHFTLVDMSEKFVEQARRTNLPNVEVRQENAENLSDKDGKYDVYVSNGVLEICQNPEWLLNEAYRVLKPGGRAAFSIYGRMGICNTLRIYKSIRMKLKLQKGISEPKFELSDPEKAKSIVKQAGFKDVLYFYEQFHFNILEPHELFGLYWDNPVLRKGAEKEGKSQALKQLIQEELEEILYEREEPLIYEALILTAIKK